MLEFVVVICSFIGLILQSSYFDYFSLLGVKPDIVLVCIVFYAVFNGPVKGGIIGAAIGLMEDLFIGHFIGPMLILRLLLGAGVGFFSRNFYKESIIIPMIVLFIATFMSNTFLWIFNSLIKNYISWTYLVKVSILQGTYNMIFMPIFYLIKRRVLLKENRG
ncbi:MAG: rod shape-determining protein MreD [Eubacteriales bacterium]|nr:rod shape-determining protein MreD [Eubacteriales bacterium]NCC81148.1 rod shape-determining protein MreD [Clostridia bacterium]